MFGKEKGRRLLLKYIENLTGETGEHTNKQTNKQ